MLTILNKCAFLNTILTRFYVFLAGRSSVNDDSRGTQARRLHTWGTQQRKQLESDESSKYRIHRIVHLQTQLHQNCPGA